MSTTDLYDADYETAAEFLDTYYRDELGQLLQKYPKDQDYLAISYRDLTRSSALGEVAEQLGYPNARDFFHGEPDTVHDLLAEAADAWDSPVDVDLSELEIRITDLPDEVTYGVGELWKADSGDFCGVRGQVQKLDRVRKRPEMLAYECQRCATTTKVPQVGDGEKQEPHECTGCERQGPFAIDFEESRLEPYQLARVQEPPEETQGGSADYIDVPLTNGLVGAVTAGDRATFSGKQHLQESSGDEGLFDPYMKPEGAEIEETDFEEVDTDEYRDEIEAIANGEYGKPLEAIVGSIAPTVFGHEDIKRGMALQLFSGVRVEYTDGSVDRGDIHVLSIGAPGTAKSTLLRAAETLAPRSMYASGKGASAAGMTAAAVRDDFGSSEWALEAGALVLANKGIACVDEIDKVDDDARSSMHDALESQRVNVNKAGINATLPAQTSLLAAGNPKYGRFDKHATESLSEQIDLGPTLLSRFDLIFMLEDTPEREHDTDVSEHMVTTREKGKMHADPSVSSEEVDTDEIDPTIPAETLRAYIAYAKQNIRPRLADEEIAQNLVDSFVEWRLLNGESDDVAVPVTYRKLEGVQRLAEASARLRLSETIEQQDVDLARDLIMTSMQQVGMATGDGEMDVDVVESNTSKSQRSRIQTLLDIVEELAHEHDKGAPTELVIDRCVSAGIDRERAEKEVSKQKVKGELYEAHSDHLRVTRE